MTWMMTGSIKEAISAEDFSIQDLNGFDAHTEMGHFDSAEASLDHNDVFRRDGLKETVAEILVLTRVRSLSGNGQPFTVPGFQYCLLTAITCAAFSEAASNQEQCLYDELYTSDAWIEAHDNLQKERRSDGCMLERVIAGLMFWSDLMHLAQFGNASAWLVYLFFGNQSKYMCACPTSSACHPVAFIPTVNDDFLEVYKNGIIVKCYNGVYCRVFPRIFTYPADYPEKVLLATICDKGVCPCPQCLPKSYFWCIGLSADMSARVSRVRQYLGDKITIACDAIYKLGLPIKGAAVECLLKEFSLVPTFVSPFCSLGFNFFLMLVVDLLHEFKLGMFKSIFKHLMRLLYAINSETIIVLNEQ
ncbi:hypothetical protein BDR04DRAFT_1130128 [Suillus decipiens]|nr:hypothetical protein BDR04DRAFT_1130128 [Suillus decipiens]